MAYKIPYSVGDGKSGFGHGIMFCMKILQNKSIQLFSSVLLVVILGVGMLVSTALAIDPNALVTCDGPECDFCTFMAMVIKVGQFIAKLLIIIAVIMLAWTGIELAAAAAGGNSDVHTILKQRMVNIVIGFLLIIASWTIVDTVLRALIPPDVDSASGFNITNAWLDPDSTGLCKTGSTEYLPPR